MRARQAAMDTFSPHAMTQVDRLRNQGVVGKGIKVAVVDTGVRKSSSSLWKSYRGVKLMMGFPHLVCPSSVLASFERRGRLLLSSCLGFD